MHGRRLVEFVAFVIVGGLLQFFVVAAIMVLTNHPLDIRVLLRDGGLYFFATSLTASSFFALWVDKGVGGATNDSIISILVAFTVFPTSVVAYVVEFQKSLPAPSLKTEHPYIQVVVTLLAIVYALYAASSSGMLARATRCGTCQPG